jgi:hypothetical protein
LLHLFIDEAFLDPASFEQVLDAIECLDAIAPGSCGAGKDRLGLGDAGFRFIC